MSMFSQGMWILTVIFAQPISHAMVVNESNTDKDGGNNDRNQEGCEKRPLGYWVTAHVGEQANEKDRLDAMTDVFVMKVRGEAGSTAKTREEWEAWEQKDMLM